MRRGRAVGGSVWNIAAAGAVVVVAVASVLRSAPTPETGSVPLQAGNPLQETEGSDGPPRGDAWEVRLLLTIIAGVALGAAATALPRLMAMSISNAVGGVVSVWMLWAAGLFAVVLTYMSTLTGSKLLLNRIDLVHTVSLVAVFLAECAMFSAFSFADDRTFRIWFVSYGAFNLTACITILLIVWKLSDWWQVDQAILSSYRKGQLADAVMASTTGVLSLVYVIRFPNPDSRTVLIVSGAALLVMIIACMKQATGRRRLRGQGLL